MQSIFTRTFKSWQPHAAGLASVGIQLSWIPDQEGHVPRNAVPAGLEKNHDIFVGFALHGYCRLNSKSMQYF